MSSCNTTNLPSFGSWPTFSTFPSLTAITGEPCLAKIDVDLAAGSEDTATAGFPLLTRVLARCSTASSAYFDGAATGKCPSTKPDKAPINPSGIPPINFALNNTDCTYHHAWL